MISVASLRLFGDNRGQNNDGRGRLCQFRNSAQSSNIRHKTQGRCKFFTPKNKTPTFQSYPDPSDFDEELYSRLHELPDGGRIDLEWVRSHVWRGADRFRLPRERVVRGMQANMFWIVAEDTEGTERRSAVGKRIVPRELPPKVD